MNKKIRLMVLSSVFAAMIFITTYFIKIPVASGYVHFGDALIYICAAFIGGPWAVLAAVVGEAMADLVGGYAVYIPATIIIKASVAFLFSFAVRNKDKMLNIISVIMSVASGFLIIGGYFIADMMINKAYAYINIVGNTVQAVGSAVAFSLLAIAFDTAKIKKKFHI